jgi:lipopolysaccharide cholinephosphotransferase
MGQQYSSNNIDNIETKYGIKKEVAKKLYKMLKDTTHLLEKNKIQYWIDGGTLLGAVRHKGLIPWDDDLDISVFYKDRHKVLKLKTQLEKYGLGLTSTFYGLKIFDLNGTPIKHNRWTEHKRQFKEKNPTIRSRKDISKYASKTYVKSKKVEYKEYKYPFMDIFYTQIKKNKIVYLKDRWEKCNQTKNDLLPLKKYKFYDLNVFGPNNEKVYLENCYGSTWNKVGLISYDHKLEKMIKPKPIKFDLTHDYRKPAKIN